MSIDKRIIRTKNKLKNSLIELLETHSFDKISVSDICKNGNINRVTFYSHYKDKDELFIDYINDVSSIVLKNATTKAIGNTYTEQIINFLCALFNETIDYYTDHHQLLKLFSYKEKASIMNIIEKKIQNDITFLFKRIFETKATKYPLEFISAFIIGGFNQLLFTTFDIENKNEIKKIKQNTRVFITDVLNSNILIK